MCTLDNSEDQDEMQHNAAFHQGLHCLLRSKVPSGTDIPHKLWENPSEYKMLIRQFTLFLRIFFQISELPSEW